MHTQFTLNSLVLVATELVLSARNKVQASIEVN